MPTILIQNNLFLLFLLTILAVFNYSSLEEFQKVTLIYIISYALRFFNLMSTGNVIFLIGLALFLFEEVLTKDEMKFKILTNPFYKFVDFLYISFFQYHLGYILLSLFPLSFHCSQRLYLIQKVPSVLLFLIGITLVLHHRFSLNSFTEMYAPFAQFPLNKVDFNEKLKQKYTILISIEDKHYFQRKGYTCLNWNYITLVISEKTRHLRFSYTIKYLFISGKHFISNVVHGSRGYSTIPMQLIRSIGIRTGYDCTFRRKNYEFLYSKMFFDGLKSFYKENNFAKQNHFRQYLLYIYFHTVHTQLDDEIVFSKFLNAFDMQYKNPNIKDIYECSNEGVFIACMGLSNSAKYLKYDRFLDQSLNLIDQSVPIKKEKIKQLLSVMYNHPFNGNYLQ